MNALYSWERIFGGTPRCRGYGAECFKVEEELCAKGLDMQTKGEGSVKSNTEELRGGVECKGDASQGLMRSLMEVRTEEVTFTFNGVNWEAPFQGPFLNVVEGCLENVGSFQWVRRGGPDGEIISIE